MAAPDAQLMRIGELARRTGMAEATLRAWERRYGIPRPQRTMGGHRLYSDQDVVRLSRIQRLVEQGWAVGAAARRVGRELAPGGGEVAVVSHRPSSATNGLSHKLRAAFAQFDAPSAHATLDDALGREAVTTVLDNVVRPTLRGLGEIPADDPAEAAQARFGLTLLRTRLAGLLSDMTGAAGDAAVVCAAEGETSELGALLRAIPLAEAGWVVRFLGADVPVATALSAGEAVDASVVLVFAEDAAAGQAVLADAEVPEGMLLVLVGAGFADAASLPAGAVVVDEPTATLAQAVRAQLASAVVG